MRNLEIPDRSERDTEDGRERKDEGEEKVGDNGIEGVEGGSLSGPPSPSTSIDDCGGNSSSGSGPEESFLEDLRSEYGKAQVCKEMLCVITTEGIVTKNWCMAEKIRKL